MRATVFVRALPLITLMICSGGRACNVPASYRIPTTLQLVERSDAIVLARVLDGGPSKYNPLRLARLVPFQGIKGDYSGRQIIFEDATLAMPKQGMTATPSDPRNLVDANPDAFKGTCNRVVFNPGMIVVAFLKRDGRNFVPFAPAFSRALEDVPSGNALWVKAVRLYAAIARKPKSLRRSEMRRQRDFLKYEIEDPDARLLALELDRALRDLKG
jgi:hypothetical protein